LNGVINMVNTIIRAMNKLHWKIPEWIPIMGGKEFGFDIQEIPTLAKGTNYFPGGYAIVGEYGAELVELPRGSKVIPARETKQIMNNIMPTIKTERVTNNIINTSKVEQVTNKIIPMPKTEQITNNRRENNVTINVQKFAEQIVVREEADIDKIADAFVNKLQKVALNYGGAT